MGEKNDSQAPAKREPMLLTEKMPEELNLDGLYVLASRLSKSSIIPKAMFNKPGEVYIGALWARENNVPLIQALQGVMVVNGRLSVWGDLFLAMIMRSPHYNGHEEVYEGKPGTDEYKAVCKFWRKGVDHPYTAEFSVGDAKTAKLWTKAGPWQEYPRRMLQMRARGFAGRDGFADALKGLVMAEEAFDIRPIEAEVMSAGTIGFGKSAAALPKPAPDVIDAPEGVEPVPVETPPEEPKPQRRRRAKPAEPAPEPETTPEVEDDQTTLGDEPLSREEKARAEAQDMYENLCDRLGEAPADTSKWSLEKLEAEVSEMISKVSG
jgi:hypothetical protein